MRPFFRTWILYEVGFWLLIRIAPVSFLNSWPTLRFQVPYQWLGGQRWKILYSSCLQGESWYSTVRMNITVYRGCYGTLEERTGSWGRGWGQGHRCHRGCRCGQYLFTIKQSRMCTLYVFDTACEDAQACEGTCRCLGICFPQTVSLTCYGIIP